MGRKKARFYKGNGKLPKCVLIIFLDRKEIQAFDSNVETIMPGTKLVDPNSFPFKDNNEQAERMCKRKEKALEKYIEKKLKKDNRPILFDRLQKASVSSEKLQSSKKLRSPKADTLPSSEGKEELGAASNTDNEEDLPPISSQFTLLHSAEIVSKNPFKAVNDLLNPSFLDSSSSDSSSSEEERPIDHIPVSVLAPSQPVFFVPVERDAAIREQRAQLPIFAEEQSIMEAIRGNPVVIICGETGSGKTTQVPQFLYEAGFGNKSSSNPGIIGVTQPRRVAAVSMAERVGTELNNKPTVGYQIRYDSSTVTAETAIKFMTDGILIREIQSDFLLSKYSIILLDEAHERNLNTDILVGMLGRIVKLRWKKANEPGSQIKPLRLVIMSATLNVDEFAKPSLFNPLPPVLKVEARQHPVTVHFSRKTDEDYVTEAFKTVSKIHANLPEGGILVFMSGKREIMTLVRQLEKKYPTALASKQLKPAEEGDGFEADFVSDVDSESDPGEEADEESDSSDSEVGPEFIAGASTTQPLHVLPLFSLMSPEEQMRIFQEPPVGSRLCVVATNVAETSLTIKNIRYVVDSGKVKQRIWDSEGRQRYEVIWASKASVAQRTGRAGRTGPGHCYRLYSAAVFENDFPKFSPPEIARMPMEGLVLQLKNMAIDNVEKFPLPTEPNVEQIIKAQTNLYHLGILEKTSFRISPFGRKVAAYPLAPCWGAFLAKAVEISHTASNAQKYLPSVAAFVSVMSIGDPFESTEDEEKTAEPIEGFKKLSWREFCGKPVVSDLFGALGAFFAYMKQPVKQRANFCRHHGFVEKRLEEMRQQLVQILKLLSLELPSWSFDIRNYPEMSSPEEKLFLRRLMAQAFSFQIAEKVNLNISNNDPNRKIASKLQAYRVLGSRSTTNDSVRFLHPSSYLVKIPPTFLVFTEAISVLDKKTGIPRHYLKNVTAIEPS